MTTATPTPVIDKGLANTIAAESAMSFIDGQKGVLEYVGIDIDALARNSTFEETVFLLWKRRLPKRFEEQGPRVIETEEGHQVWMMEDTPYFQVGFMAVAGRAHEDRRVEPARFDEVRPGCWRIKDRIRDMDINGVWASLNFPSGVTGFGGTLFSETKDPELGLACVRAWNDWLFEEWYGSYAERILPLGSAPRSLTIPRRPRERRAGSVELTTLGNPVMTLALVGVHVARALRRRAA
mgnify:CR=1 FL=1